MLLKVLSHEQKESVPTETHLSKCILKLTTYQCFAKIKFNVIHDCSDGKKKPSGFNVDSLKRVLVDSQKGQMTKHTGHRSNVQVV